eukprot:3287945-Pleurochrysis_carterae.AAC.1
MSALACIFKCHLQLACEFLTRSSVLLFETFHLLTVEVGVPQHCLREGLDDVNALDSRSKSATSKKKSGSTLPAEYPARFASFESAVVVELVDEIPLGLADENFGGALEEVKGVVCYIALERFDTSFAPLFFVRAAVDVLVVLGW